MIVRQVGRFGRECGCRWDVIPPSELTEEMKRRIPEASWVLPAARFTHRCPEHAPMCRLLEPWELNLTREAA
jgi:hypothetical protein